MDSEGPNDDQNFDDELHTALKLSPKSTRSIKISIAPSSEPRRHYHSIDLSETTTHESPDRSQIPGAIKIPRTEPKPRSNTLYSKPRYDGPLASTKSFSETDLYDSPKRESLLVNAKSHCELELQVFLEMIAKHQSGSEVYELINSSAQRMMALTLEEIKAGECKSIVDRVQKLQQRCFKKRLPGKENVTKLLLIISRVSRLIEHLELASANTISHSSEAVAISDSEVRRISIDLRKSSPSLGTKSTHESSPNISDSSGFMTFLGNVKRKLNFNKAISPSVEESDFKQSPPENLSKEFDEKLKIPEKPDAEFSLMCRICEELVQYDHIEEHSRTCAMESKNDMQASLCDTKLSKFVASLDKRINGGGSTRHMLTIEDMEVLIEMREILVRAISATFDDEMSIDQIQHCINSMKKFGQEDDTEINPRRVDSVELIRSLRVRITDVLQEKLELLQKGEQGRFLNEDSLKLKRVGSFRAEKPRLSDFDILKPISRGAFGKVLLAKKKKTGDVYAIKVMNKDDLRIKNQVEHIKAERNILAHTQHPYLVKFYYSFQTKENLFMVMEYLAGGDLFSLLKNLQSFDINMTRVYIAQVTLALGYLHSKGIIHRDLKPDNLLVGADGHLKLTDFGLSRFALYDLYMDNHGSSSPLSRHLYSPLAFDSPSTSPTTSPQCSPKTRRNNRRYSMVGTPDYLAPEVILGTGHGQAVDWWSLGVIAFEFLTGFPPFNGDSAQADSTSELLRFL
eukprot:TRINITY_DN4370_c0_g3_i2.p1 TRINITY_DN4370_c0_g3~~TRINITY_DN4370_c0_g3_i2.p1  ORF type:complete len:740 (-),score=160.35 TRINITY_DN4370_c0_g3_i2:85-2304(-)